MSLAKCSHDDSGNLVVTFDTAGLALQEVLRRERDPDPAKGYPTWDGDKRMIIHASPFDRNGGQKPEVGGMEASM